MSSSSFDVKTLVTCILLGIGVLTAYILCFRDKGANYITHPYWLGMSPDLVWVLVVLQIFAAIGFLTAIITWIRIPPVGGILDNDRLWMFVGFFILSAIVWPIALRYDVKWLVVMSLISTAIATILLLAGSIEETKPRLHVVIGLIALNVVTVLADGVLWNAKYIKG